MVHDVGRRFGAVSEGGALTLNGVSAVGVLGMGILGAPLMGLYLDKGIDADLKTTQPALYAKVDGGMKATMFGESPSLKNDVVESLPEAEAAQVGAVVNANKKKAFIRQSALPAFMLLIYLILFFHFRSKGGYKPQELASSGGGGGAESGS